MNSEKELINRIRTLRQIKPDNDWEVSVKARILGQEAIGSERFLVVLLKNFAIRYRVVLAGLLLVAGTGGGLLAAAQNALPGEPLYGLKKTAEKAVALAIGQSQDPNANLILAARRLEEIDIISQKNLVKNLPAAFYEYKTAKAAAKKEMAEQVKKNPDKAADIIKKTGLAMKDIDDKEKRVYAVLGLEQNASSTQETGEFDSDKEIIDSLIDYYQDGAELSETQAIDLAKVEEFRAVGEYGRAVNYYLESSLNK